MSILCLVLLTAATLLGQVQSQPPAFEVASIKLADPNASDGGFHVEPGGRFVARNFTLQNLVQTALSLQAFRIIGLSGWTTTERYNIEAQAPSPISEAQGRTLLLELLKDRFSLRLRADDREMLYYALVQSRTGAKLSPTKSGTCTPTDESFPPAAALGELPYCSLRERVIRLPSGTYQFEFSGLGIRMQEFARLIGGLSDRVGLDETNLPLRYDILIRYVDPERASGLNLNGQRVEMDSTPTLTTALEEQLGLKVETRRGPIEIFVVDQAEKPSEN